MTDTPPVLPPSRKWLWVVLLASPLIVLLLLVLAMEFGGRQRLQSTIGEAARSGPVRFEDILGRRRAWPADQDAGPVFEDLHPRLTALSETPELKAAPLAGGPELPPLGHRWTPEAEAAAATALAKASEELAVLDRIAAMPGGSLPLTPSENPIDTLLPSLSPLRLGAKILGLRAMSGAMSGDTSGVPHDVAAMCSLANLLTDHPTLISSLVAVAVDSLAVDMASRACGVATLTPEQLTELQQVFEAQATKDPLYWGMLGERAFFLQNAEYMMRTGNAMPEMGMPNVLRVPGARGWLKRDVAVGMDMYGQLIAVLDKPRERLRVARQLEADVQRIPAYYFYTRSVMPALGRAFELGLQRDALLRSASVAMAAERYRLVHGAFPENLGELVPEYLEVLPLDPFNDQPLLYARQPDRVIVYSVGINGADDGGQVQWLRGQRRGLLDVGFMLLDPAQRGLPPVPESGPEAELGPAESAPARE